MAISSVLGSVLIPLHNKSLLLPNVSMAELIAFRKPLPSEKTPDWHLGSLSWRGVSIPVISFEALNGGAVNPDFSQARIAVFNNVGVSEKLPFFGVVTQGIPRSIKLVNADIGKDATKPGPAEAAVVTVKGEVACIPNIDFIESAIVKAKIV
jgi:chemosensory pili system protein ChpC